MILSIVIAAVLVQCLIVAFVLSKKDKDGSHVLFACAAFSLAAWAFANYLSTILVGDALLYAMRSVMALVVVQNTFLTLFCYFYPIARVRRMGWRLYIYLAFSLITVALTLTPLVFIDTTLVNGTPYPEAGPGILIFLIHAVSSVIIGMAQLVKRRRRSVGSARAQLAFIILGVALLWTIVPVTNLVVTLVLQTTLFIRLSAVYVLIFSSIIAYTIVRHRMFDIRLVVARSVAYSLVIITMGLLYGFVVFGVAERLFPSSNATGLQQVFYTLAAVFLALTFQPIKRLFDRVSDRIFYRNRYSSEDVLNRLGKVFVTKGNSFELLDDTLQIIVSALRVESGRLIVVDNNEIYATAHTGDGIEVETTAATLSRFPQQINILDEAHSSDEQTLLRSLKSYTVVRLTTQNDLVGYLLLGAKQSGTIYTQQDINLLEILAQELAVAVQNAKSYEEIQAFSETLKNEVDEATAQLRETNQRLIKLDEAKDEFISMASHQLRTPLTTIKGYLSMLLEGDAGKLTKKQTDFIDLAFVSSERMVHLIADMLNVSRISTGRLTIDTMTFDLAEVVSSEIDQLRRQAEARDVKLTLHKSDKSIMVRLDETKLRQVIMNFTDNAIYYAPEGQVDIYIEQHDQTVEFRVKDNGIGVSVEAQKRLFSKFFRAENAQHVRPDGTGLGLYMAKQVIEAQDGELIFESTEGKGSTFGFRFKLKD
ncbi:MAG: ATP-binding protein [Candidatus Saccharimonadales bacterium]